MKVYHGKKVHDGRKFVDDLYIGVEDKQIVYVGREKPEGEFVGSFPFITPAFIDAHSHIGMDRAGEPFDEGEANDISDIFTPLLNPLNSVYFDDHALKEAVQFGVLYSCIIPGSGNVFGGRAIVIRNFAGSRESGFFKDYGFKMALGYNPRSTLQWRGTRFNTRMGVYAHLEAKFEEVRRKAKKISIQKKKELDEIERKYRKGEMDTFEYVEKKRQTEELYDLEFNDVERAILELLERKKVAKVHVHKADDVLYLIELVKRFGFKATADHLGDVHEIEIFRALKNAGINAVYGPLDSFPYKVELKHERLYNVKLLMDSGLFFGLMTDHPVILAKLLFITLRNFLYFGMSEEEALSIITYRNAKILEIDDKVGTIERGKLASIILWKDDPFRLASRPEMVVAEGKEIKWEDLL